ncbi:hypothetical protein FRC17_001635, partial [Serendipita sp. 399]
MSQASTTNEQPPDVPTIKNKELSDLSQEIQSTARDIESLPAVIRVYESLLRLVKATENKVAGKIDGTINTPITPYPASLYPVPPRPVPAYPPPQLPPPSSVHPQPIPPPPTPQYPVPATGTNVTKIAQPTQPPISPTPLRPPSVFPHPGSPYADERAPALSPNTDAERLALASWKEWTTWWEKEKDSLSNPSTEAERLENELKNKALLYQGRRDESAARLSTANDLFAQQTSKYAILEEEIRSSSTEQSSSSPSSIGLPPTITIFYNDKDETFDYPTTYQDLTARARERFTISPYQAILVVLHSHTKPSEAITAQAWPYVYPPVKSVHIKHPEQPLDTTSAYQITVKDLLKRTYNFNVSPVDTIGSLKEQIQSQTGLSRCQIRLVYGGKQLEDGKTIEEYSIGPGSIVFMVLALRKPVIYLFSTTPTKAQVSLSLCSSLSFTTLYPVVPVQKSDSESEMVNWNVETQKDGTLLDLESGLEVAYLYWEADTKPPGSMTPPSSRPATPAHVDRSPSVAAFDPTRPELTPENSVIVDMKKIPTYLDTTLRALGLHTEARTSFIT